ncbi:helix-turn-helix domain-containing protein [Streptomyces sp. NPDC004752]
MGNTFSLPTCAWCGGERRLQATGRPGSYCSTKCRQAAHRHKQAAARPPDTEQYDQALHVQLKQIIHTAQAVIDALGQPEAHESELLGQAVRLQVLAERMTPGMVARARQRGASWEQIGSLLGMSKDTARKKWSQLSRRAGSPQRTAPAPAPPVPAVPPDRSPAAPAAGLDSGDIADRAGPATLAAPAVRACPPPAAGHGDLASVLSSLQRASGLSLRALAGRSSLSPSYLSRLMSGERFPSWKNTAALARACGADPEVLRKVWETSQARRAGRPYTASLASALRYLHQRAGSPTPWVISVTSGHRLGQDYVAALLDGTATGPWEDIHRLVQLLDGEPAYFLPLWETETAALPAPRPAPPPPAPKPPAREEPQPPARRVEELLIAFKDALGPTHLTTPRPRRRLATPIASAWR